jgi:hypothetical protein
MNKKAMQYIGFGLIALSVFVDSAAYLLSVMSDGLLVFGGIALIVQSAK